MAQELDPFDIDTMLAQQRLKQASEYQPNIPKGGMVGDVYVGAHPMQMLSEALRGYGAGQEKQAAANQLKGIAQQRQELRNQAMADFLRQSQGTPEFQAAGPAPQGAPQEGGYTVPAQKGNLMGAYSGLMNSSDPMLAQMGMHGIQQIPAMQQQAELKREQMAQNAQIARERLQDRQDARMMALANRPEKMVTVLGPNGEAISLPQSQAGGMQMYNPMAAKEIQKQKTQGEAKQQLSDIVGSLKGNYDALNKNFGITSTGNRTGSNIGAAIGSSGVGQLVGGVLGTENQQQRQEIEQTRPLLLNAIKNATGMSAQQMNSNAELSMYLKAATDPKLGYEANMKALNNLDKMYGLGINFPKESTPDDGGGLPSADAIAAELARRGGK